MKATRKRGRTKAKPDAIEEAQAVANKIVSVPDGPQRHFAEGARDLVAAIVMYDRAMKASRKKAKKCTGSFRTRRSKSDAL